MLAVDVIPDTFRTVGNVTAHLAVTAMVAGGSVVADAAVATAPPIAEGVLPQAASAMAPLP